MAIVKWNPLQELQAMQEQMSRLFEMSRHSRQDDPFSAESWQPPVDIYEDEGDVVVIMELPEVEQRDISVQIEGGALIISGERRLAVEASQRNYLRIERGHGLFQRTFTLPSAIDQEKIRASIEQGLLKVILPKKGESTPRQIVIDVG